MGLTYHTYLGPHVICKVHQVEVVKKRITCADPQCKHFGYDRRFRNTNEKFCSSCGTQFIEQDFVDKEDNVNQHSLLVDGLEKFLRFPYGLDRKLKNSSQHLWLANIRIPEMREFSFYSTEEALYWPILQSQIYAEVDRFEEFFAEAMAILEQHYGVNNVIMSWGLIHEIS